MEETEVKESQEAGEEKPRWMDLFERESHRRCQIEYLRDKEYEDIINTLRRGFAEEEEDKEGPPFHIQIPPEQYFLTPDLDLECQLYGGRRSGSGTSGTFSTSQSESSFGESTITTSLPTSSRKYLPPEVIEEKKRSRRRRTAAYICLGVLAIALVALAVGVILHFLLETGSIGGGGRVPSPKEQ